MNLNNKDITYDYLGNSIILKEVHPMPIEHLMDHIHHNVIQNKNIVDKLEQRVKETNEIAQLNANQALYSQDTNKDLKKRKTQFTTNNNETCQSFGQNMRMAK